MKELLAGNIAGLVAVRCGIAPRAAYSITRVILNEAGASILKLIGRGGKVKWNELSFKDKSAICAVVVKGLLDKKNVVRFLSGDKKSIV